MNIETRESSGVTVLSPEGRMALGGGDLALRKAINGALEGGSSTILLNLSGLTYVDSSGLGEIADSYKNVTAAGGILALCEAQSTLRTLLKVTGLDKVIKIFDSEPAALEELQAN